MRGAGCTVNDYFDRDIDAKVARTTGRPIPSGVVAPVNALFFALAQCILILSLLRMVNVLTAVLGTVDVALIFIYPLMKRYIWWPQAFLGLVNWGVLGGFGAATGRIDSPAILLYAGSICWTLGYDTIYALQDVADDARANVRSTARLFGSSVRLWIIGFYALTAILVGAAFASAKLSMGCLPFLLAAFIQLGWQISTLRANDPEDCLGKFKSNQWFGLIILLALIFGCLLER